MKKEVRKEAIVFINPEVPKMVSLFGGISEKLKKQNIPVRMSQTKAQEPYVLTQEGIQIKGMGKICEKFGLSFPD